jgi:hypothetical protein
MDSKIMAAIVDDFSLNGGNRKVFGIMIISGLFILLARILAPVEIQYDQNLQIEAAYRLVRGLGLTLSTNSSPDLNLHAQDYVYLTSFPPAFSLMVACLLFVKLPLASALKFIYSFATIIGWLGWATIASRLLVRPIRFGSITLPIQLIIAAILPVFYTPSWSYQGTDIFLWSGVPLLVLLMHRLSIRNPNNFRSLVLSGLITGVLISFRHASLFLYIFVFLCLLRINFSRVKIFLFNYSIFILSSFCFVIPILIYYRFATTIGASNLPSVSESLNIPVALDRVMNNLSTISTISGIIPTQLLSYIKSNIILNYTFGVFCLVVVILLPFFILKNKRLNLSPRRDITILLSLLPLSLVFFLIATIFSLKLPDIKGEVFIPLGLPRYYIPVNLCLILIAYKILTIYQSTKSLTKKYISLFLVLFFAYNLIYRPSGLLFGKYKSLSEVILGIHPIPGIEYPSNEVFTRCQSSLSILRRLSRENPEALFLIENYSCYNYDNHPSFIAIKGAFKMKPYVSKPTKVFWVINSPTCKEICASPMTTVLKLSSLPNVKTVYVDPIDKTRIKVSDLPAGYRFLPSN